MWILEIMEEKNVLYESCFIVQFVISLDVLCEHASS